MCSAATAALFDDLVGESEEVLGQAQTREFAWGRQPMNMTGDEYPARVPEHEAQRDKLERVSKIHSDPNC